MEVNMSIEHAYEQTAQSVLDRIAIAAKKKRLALQHSQEEAAFHAGVSIKAVQAVESAKNCHVMKLMTYLAYLGLTDALLASLPDPERLTPIEKMAISKGKVDDIKKARVSRTRKDSHEGNALNHATSKQAYSEVAEKKLPWKTE